MKRLLVLHPLLFAIYPVLALLAHNVSEVRPTAAIRPVLVCAAIAIILLLITRLALRDWGKAALVSSVALVLFFSYREIYEAVKATFGTQFGRNLVLVPIFAILLIAWTWWVVRKSRYIAQLQVFFGLVGLVSLIFPLYTVISYNARPVRQVTSPITSNTALTLPQSGALPNIYYIIVDAYGRQDVLSAFYNYDNSGFINFLKDKGFYVADDSHSNYPVTILSLSSSLNMEYLDQEAQELGTSSTDERPLQGLIADSEVRADLKSLGYQMVAFPTGRYYTEVTDADKYIKYQQQVVSTPFTDFEVLLFNTTMARDMVKIQLPGKVGTRVGGSLDPTADLYEAHRQSILFTLSEMTQIPNWQGSYFVFAHVIIPHPPFVFGPNGEPRNPTGIYTLQDGEGFPGTSAEYIAGYRDQVAYLNKLLESTINAIIQRSAVPPIIIIQGDHGPRSLMQYNSTEKTNMHEALSILNAYYFPGIKNSTLYPSITPVNSFRVLFNLYFGGHFDLLKDESYFSTMSKPFTFIDVTQRTRTDP